MTTLTEKQEQTLNKIARDSVYRHPERIGTSAIPFPSGIIAAINGSPRQFNGLTLKSLFNKGLLAWAVFHRDSKTMTVSTNYADYKVGAGSRYGKIAYIALTAKAQDFRERAIAERDVLTKAVEADHRKLVALARKIVDESGLDDVLVIDREPTLLDIQVSVNIAIKANGYEQMTLILKWYRPEPRPTMIIGSHVTRVSMNALDDMAEVFRKATVLKDIALDNGVTL